MDSPAAPRFDPARVQRQQMLFVYMLLVAGVAFVVQTLVLTGFRFDPSHGVGLALGYGVSAFLFLGAYYLRRGILRRASAAPSSASPVGTASSALSAPDLPREDPGFCPSCGAPNPAGSLSCRQCQAALRERRSFLLEQSRSDSDVRQLQVILGLSAAFLLGLLAWAISPLTRVGRVFVEAVRGATPITNAGSASFFLLILGPLGAWVLWQALNVRRTSGRSKLILAADGVTFFDDSKHRLFLRWDDPAFLVRIRDSAGNPQWDRQTIFLLVPTKGNGAVNFNAVALRALTAEAQSRGLVVVTAPEEIFGAGMVQVTTISPSVLRPA